MIINAHIEGKNKVLLFFFFIEKRFYYVLIFISGLLRMQVGCLQWIANISGRWEAMTLDCRYGGEKTMNWLSR